MSSIKMKRRTSCQRGGNLFQSNTLRRRGKLWTQQSTSHQCWGGVKGLDVICLHLFLFFLQICWRWEEAGGGEEEDGESIDRAHTYAKRWPVRLQPRLVDGWHCKLAGWRQLVTRLKGEVTFICLPKDSFTVRVFFLLFALVLQHFTRKLLLAIFTTAGAWSLWNRFLSKRFVGWSNCVTSEGTNLWKCVWHGALLWLCS